MTARLERADVWRVERERDGRGPYQVAGGDLYDMGFAHSDKLAHPGPYEDGPLVAACNGEKGIDRILYSRTDTHNWAFGFASEAEALVWFDGWLELLDDEGFVLRRYSAFDRDVRRGAKQLLFAKRGAEITETVYLA